MSPRAREVVALALCGLALYAMLSLATFRLADPGSPTVIQDREGASALYVLMPMRV